MKHPRDHVRGAAEAKSPPSSRNVGGVAASDHNQEQGFYARRVSLFGAAGVIVIALSGLLGYVPGLGLLGSVKEGYIPMAPSTVISFIVLGGILLAMTLRSLSGASLVLSGALAALVSVFGALEVAGYFIGRDLSLEDAVIPSAGYLGDIPIGRMSPSTAAAFFFAGLSTIALVLRNTARSRRTHLEHWAGCLGSLVLGISIIFCLAYLYGNPLMYGQGATVPMALTTTFGFLMLGTAAVSASGRDAIPVRLFAGPSTSSHLLRVFLPLTTLSTLVGGFVVLRARMFSGLNPTLVSAATTVVTASITGFITIWVARRVASAITQSKVARDHAMASLRESEERYRAIAEDSPGLICRFLPGGEITFVNDAYCRYFEKTAEELAGSSFLSLIPEEDRETVMANIAALTVESPTDSIEHAAIAPGGEIRWQRWTSLALFDKEGKAAAYQAIGEDITERKQAQDALRESEERLRLMMQQSPSVIEVYDARGLQVDVNDAYEALWGFPADHTVNQFNVLKSRQVEATGLLEYVKRAYTGETVKVPEYAFDSRGETEGRGRGRIRWLNTRIYPLKDGDGSVHHIVLTHEDITDRKRAEEGLHRLDQQLRTGIDQMPMAYILWDRKFRAIEWNASAERIFGYSKAELVGKHPLDYIVPDAVRPMVHEVIEDLLAGKVASYSEEGNNIRKDGSVISCQWYNTPLKDETGATFAVLSMVIDITDRRRAEEERRELEAQLRQSQKMEAVGQLAGGVAHDFNNILTTILVNVELSIGSVRSELGADHRVAECMEEIEKAAQRASVLTRQLLTFSRRAVMQPEVLNLNRILADLDKMLQRLITEDITLDTVTDPNLQSVRADAGQLEQVIVNLVVNAAHAMPDGGRLTVETQNVTLDEDYTNNHAEAQPGPCVLLTVSDTGHGMDAATCERVFEPFFTTKSVDKGSGLGLATVHGIVKQSGGHIIVYSEPGCGTTFKIYLPAVESTGAVPPPKTEPDTLPRGSETVLLCEDDRPVRELIALSLRTAGYTVITAGSGQEGLEAAQAHSGSLDLLITDVIMPDMNGRALSERLCATFPGLPILFISGYTSDIIAHRDVLDDGVEFLEKPFTRRGLLEKVRAVLGKPQTDA